VEEFDYTMGTSPPGESYNEESIGIPMYQGNADFGSRFPTNRVFTTDPKRFAEKYDTLVSVRAPVGEQNMANERCCIGRGVAAFRFKKDNSFYTYTYYKIKSLMNDIKQFNETGTVFGSINKSDFENIEITIPDMITISQFQIEVKPIDNKIIINTNQICTLIALRDALLLKFMSREIKINL
jgi:type I restriction enzyme S subunit